LTSSLDYAYIQAGNSSTDTGAKLRISRYLSSSALAEVDIVATDVYMSNDLGVDNYIYALGGLHVGGTSDPGTDNLEVDGEAVVQGDVAIGHGTPSYKLDVKDNVGTYVAKFVNDGNASDRDGLVIQVGEDTNCSASHIVFTDGDFSYLGHISGDGAGGMQDSWSSDIRYKHVVGTIDGAAALDAITHIDPIVYTGLNTPNGQRRLGFSAQAMERHFPEIVNIVNDGRYSLSYSKITPILWAGQRALLERIQELEARIEELEAA
jgi:hypothetical protein